MGKIKKRMKMKIEGFKKEEKTIAKEGRRDIEKKRKYRIRNSGRN